MLGAVISFVGFLLAISWWVLYKRFGKFSKGEESLPISLFVIYCALCFLLLGFLLSVVFSVIPEFLPRPYKHQLDNSPEILFSFVFLIVISFIAYQCYQYIKIVKQNNRNNKSNYTISNRLSETKREIPSDQRDYASNDSFASTISDEVRFCKYCGTRIDNETIYCPHCGKRIQEDRFRSTSTTMSKNCLTEDSNEPLSDIRESNSLINGQHESSVESPDNNAQETNVIQNSFSEINSSEEKDDGKEKNDSHKGKKGAMQDGKFIILFIISVIIICAFFILNTPHNNTGNEPQRNDSTAIILPHYSASDSLRHLTITRILLTPNQTIIDFHVKSEGYSWCTINKDAYICNNKKKYYLREAIGIEISPKVTYFNDEGTLNFSLIFPSIPSDVETIDFIESDDSQWKVYNIIIDSDNYKERDDIVKNIVSNMIFVEGGQFTMGFNETEERNVKPAHQVELTSYFIGKYEVTQKEWELVMGSNPSYFSINDKYPVECVSWNKCVQFATRVGLLTGKKFRLPTEAEWEYAAKGGKNKDTFKFSGNDDINTVAWYKGNSKESTHPVGEKKPNSLGLYDMTGNVAEWCLDYQGDYTSERIINPKGPNNGKRRISRGGAFDCDEIVDYGFPASDLYVYSRTLSVMACVNCDETTDEDDIEYVDCGLRLVMDY